MVYRCFGDVILGETRCVVLGDTTDSSNRIVFDMPTAIFTLYTSQGWVIASDGLGTDGRVPDENVKKIFPIKGRSLAYTLIGSTKLLHDEQVVVDLGQIILDTANSLKPPGASDPSLYLERLCRPVHKSLHDAKKWGLIRYPEKLELPPEPGQTVLWVFLIGYFNDTPVCTHCRIFHRDQELAGIAAQNDLVVFGFCRSHGPIKVWSKLEDPQDETFSAYQTPLPASKQITLLQGIESANNHIRVCFDPRAREIAPETCATIGGRIQIATITLSQGFQWVPGFESVGERP